MLAAGFLGLALHPCAMGQAAPRKGATLAKNLPLMYQVFIAAWAFEMQTVHR